MSPSFNGAVMREIFEFGRYTKRQPELRANSALRDGGVVAIDPALEALCVLPEPTLNYRTKLPDFPDQIWTWDPVLRAWLRNRERVLDDLSAEYCSEILNYIRLSLDLQDAWGRPVPQGEVNEFITHSDRWSEFEHLRSMNTYDPVRGEVPGITPRSFAIVSSLGVTFGDGHPLTAYRKY